MNCPGCAREISDDSAYCAHCGARQRSDAPGSSRATRLERSLTDRQVAGVCGGLGVYLGLDSAVVRILWVVLTILGAVLPGLFVYLVAWLIVPETQSDAAPATAPPRLKRSETDVKLAGVCSGLAEYFEVDSTPIRLLWVVATLCTGIVGGVLAYAVAWATMPTTTLPAAPPAPPARPEPPPETQPAESA